MTMDKIGYRDSLNPVVFFTYKIILKDYGICVQLYNLSSRTQLCIVRTYILAHFLFSFFHYRTALNRTIEL